MRPQGRVRPVPVVVQGAPFPTAGRVDDGGRFLDAFFAATPDVGPAVRGPPGVGTRAPAGTPRPAVAVGTPLAAPRLAALGDGVDAFSARPHGDVPRPSDEKTRPANGVC